MQPKIKFPTPQDLHVNMMPIIMGDPETLPSYLKSYLPLINACEFEHGTTVYLTIDESHVSLGESQRRGGIHTEAFKPLPESSLSSWGGGWGGSKGVYMTSSDGACEIWETETENVNHHGGVLDDLSSVSSFQCEPNTLYWMTDKTPHQALPSISNYRQFFRLVSEDVDVWFAQHNTPNPLGIEPNALKVWDNKFG